MNKTIELKVLTKKDFETDQDVRWCPGCGDYAVLSQIQKVLPTLGIPRENFAFVSGIGCSSRFPYYMETYGLHSIHGRAPAIATGLKLSRPELSVWVATGDGDALAIGGNHFIHAMRRNIGLKIILLNNRIYGLTKGQFSPTSVLGQKTKSTPYGNVDRPFSPTALALGAGATFVARTLDTDLPTLAAVLKRAAEHKGTAFVEIYQNCNVFNDGAYAALTDKATRDDTRVILEHGKPIIFGKNKDKGVRLNGLTPEVVTLGENGITEKDLIVHDETQQSSLLGLMLSQFEGPDLPVPFGVFRSVEQPVYEELYIEQAKAVRAQKGTGSLEALLNSGNTWEITE